jgi:hypothetical protein
MGLPLGREPLECCQGVLEAFQGLCRGDYWRGPRPQDLDAIKNNTRKPPGGFICWMEVS